MIDFLADELRSDSDWRLLLGAYQDQARQVERGPEGADGNWTPRLTNVAGIEPSALSRVHGKLIALGLLDFEVNGNKLGVHYQLSPLGRQLLAGGLPTGETSRDDAELAACANAAAND